MELKYCIYLFSPKECETRLYEGQGARTPADGKTQCGYRTEAME